MHKIAERLLALLETRRGEFAEFDKRIDKYEHSLQCATRALYAKEPDDYVVATGASYSVGQFVEMAFAHAGLDWERHVRFDDRYLRPSEVDALVGDATKATRELLRLGFGIERELVALAERLTFLEQIEEDIARLRTRRDRFREPDLLAKLAAEIKRRVADRKAALAELVLDDHPHQRLHRLRCQPEFLLGNRSCPQILRSCQQILGIVGDICGKTCGRCWGEVC